MDHTLLDGLLVVRARLVLVLIPLLGGCSLNPRGELPGAGDDSASSPAAADAPDLEAPDLTRPGVAPGPGASVGGEGELDERADDADEQGDDTDGTDEPGDDDTDGTDEPDADAGGGDAGSDAGDAGGP